jgi:DNA-binding NarL/FixJ family response regulator
MKRTSYQERNRVARELYGEFAKDLATISHRVDEVIGLYATNQELRDSLRKIRISLTQLMEKSSHVREEKYELSDRENEVLHLLATGSTAKQISIELFLSEATIKSHTASLYRKLGATNKVEAIAAAEKLGLLK